MSIALNCLLFLIMAISCIVCISDYFEKGSDMFALFLQAFSIMIFAIINILAVTRDD